MASSSSPPPYDSGIPVESVPQNVGRLIMQFPRRKLYNTEAIGNIQLKYLFLSFYNRSW